MKFEFHTAEDFILVQGAIKSGIMYWKKVRQDAQGKICLQCNGEQTHYSVEYANEQIGELLDLLMLVEATPHWDWDGEKEVYTTAEPEFYSAMVESNRRYLRCDS